MAIEFEKFEFVHPRDIWAHEEYHFTPWLADNLSCISDSIGVSLDRAMTEVPVERFSADILACDMDGGSVLIENQLEGSDHIHMGQILTYLAGLKARTVVWVACDFEEVHLSAVRWLNENTAADFSFFAIRVSVAKIDDSLLIPQFKVLERPSDWDRQVRGVVRAGGSGRDVQSVLFGDRFWECYANRYPDDDLKHRLSGRNPSFPLHGMEITIIRYDARRKRVGQQVAVPDARFYQSSPESMELYLPALKKTLGKETLGMDGNEMIWGAPFIQLKIDISNPANWQQAAKWLHRKLEIYCRIISQMRPVHN